MLIFPAMDLRLGRCVRLYQGDPTQETVFSDDPVAMALQWAIEGIQWLHLVNLDGAFGEQSDTPLAVQSVVRTVAERGISVQYGGGLRTLADIEQALGWGAARVILGTVALREPELLRAAIEQYGAERIAVGIDARAGKVAVHGWSETSEVEVLAFAQEMKALGVTRVIYTDIARDGTQQGINIAATGELAQQSGLKVIASGGVGSLDDILQVRWLEPYGIEGVIVGRALYEETFTLQEALALVADKGKE
ncbi:MAG: 1-(5-phosphoribosyl)-5-[(5-phosphoribosylamino)methylideneamino]imidazole-4-carboxamide isomerase [Ardenticatenales bacterium]|nr:1-(5-phosphoribosyl)-5-[(5-phosphoribosylamino)methylideneamino]imidazole-4-carboxamide isomerase [Ardenticatenales bacterium]